MCDGLRAPRPWTQCRFFEIKYTVRGARYYRLNLMVLRQGGTLFITGVPANQVSDFLDGAAS